MMYLMRHIYAEDILKYIMKKVANFEIIAKNNFSYLEDMLKYIIEKGESENTSKLLSVFQEIVPQEKRGNIMTIAERLKQEGKEIGFKNGKIVGIKKGKLEGKLEGRLEGKLQRNIEIAKKMLLSGLDIKSISKFTELSVEEIKKIK